MKKSPPFRISIQTSLCLVAILAVISPAIASASSFSITPASGNFAVGSNAKATLTLRADGSEINAAQGTLRFPNDKLVAKQVAKSGLFSFWQTEPHINNNAGTIEFVGGRLGSFNGNSAVFNVTFQVKNPGQATLTLDNGKILAADGSGSNVYSGSGSAHWNLTKGKEAAPSPELPPAPVISSSTNPDQNQWYNNNEHSFSWPVPLGVTEVAYTIDTADHTEPQSPIPVTDHFTNNAIPEGTNYIHVRFKNAGGWGPSGHFKLMKDTSPPETSIRLLAPTRTYDRQSFVQILGSDKLSGIAKREISINDHGWLPVETDEYGIYQLPKTDIGPQIVAVRMTDKAGNTGEAKTTFTILPVQAGHLSLIQTKFMLWNILLLVLLLIVIIILAFWLWRLHKRLQKNEHAISVAHHFMNQASSGLWTSYTTSRNPEEAGEHLAKAKEINGHPETSTSLPAQV